ncbi:acyl-CoA thioesterase [Desulfovibrio sp. OttesenSCG-928-C06]|nr:acyl-CoA thioesterase [Desulfovibrio sp. OttesenSCG-928-C06]
MKDFPEKHVWHTYRISYGDTDAMGILYYANYLQLFERMRSEIIRASGVSYAEVEKRGVYLPVRHAECRYRSPLRYDDLANMRGGISEWGRASVTFVYEIWNEDRTLLHATGSTQHAITTREASPMRVPAWLREIFE